MALRIQSCYMQCTQKFIYKFVLTKGKNVVTVKEHFIK
jgi:hypothetical protein